MKKGTKLLIGSLLLIGCNSHKTLKPEVYLKYMEAEDNGFTKKLVSGSTEYEVQLAPPQYMSCKQYIDELQQGHIDHYKKRLQEIKDYTFFLIKMRRHSDEQQTVTEQMVDNGKAEQKIMYYQQQAQADILLHTDVATLAPATYLYEDNYGLAPYNTIIVGFATKADKDMQLEFNDRFTHTPLIKTGYSKQELQTMPDLNLKTN